MSSKELGAIIGASVLFGFGIGGLSVNLVQEAFEKRRNKLKPGVYVNGGMTSMALIAVGLHALKDGVYDTYELHDILKEVNKKETEK